MKEKNPKTKGAFFYSQFWDNNGKHCVTNMAADEEAAALHCSRYRSNFPRK